MGRMRRPYREFDAVMVGDIIDLGGRPRRVETVSRDKHDRLRWVGVNRLACGHATYSDGTKMEWCSGPVQLYHTDLRTPSYRFRGWHTRASGAEEKDDG